MQIHGSKGKFNLKCGIATDFHFYDDSTKRRYTVKLDSGEVFKVKPANLRRALGTGKTGKGKGKGKGKKSGGGSK